MADDISSIPSVIDGFTSVQRKVMYAAFKKNWKKEIKVREFASVVSQLTAYPQDPFSPNGPNGPLQQTIIGLAQSFVCSNNINYLEPHGNFGSRLQGGSDAAAGSFIYTKLSPLASRIFHTVDEALLTYNVDNGKTIEPELYMPIIPTILVNGADNVHIGWRQSIPKYNPEDIIANIRRRMRGSSKSDMLRMKPWYRGWKGEIQSIDRTRGKYRCIGKIDRKGINQLEITELPVRVWTQDFENTLENILKAELPSSVNGFTDLSAHDKVHFVISLDDRSMKRALKKGLIEQFKLSTINSSTNFVALNSQGQTQVYDTELDILEEFYLVRLSFYEKRKQYLLSELQKDLDKINNQLRFIQMLSEGKLPLVKSKAQLVSELQRLNFKPVPTDVKSTKKRKLRPSEAEDHDESVQDRFSDYDYLLGLTVWCMTQEHAEQLQKQIAGKQSEIAELSKKSPEDLWEADLEDLVAEWKDQLQRDLIQEQRAPCQTCSNRRR